MESYVAISTAMYGMEVNLARNQLRSVKEWRLTMKEHGRSCKSSKEGKINRWNSERSNYSNWQVRDWDAHWKYRKIRIRSLFWNEAKTVKGSKRENLLAKGRLNAQGSAFVWIRGEEGESTLFNTILKLVLLEENSVKGSEKADHCRCNWDNFGTVWSLKEIGNSLERSLKDEETGI